MNPSDEKRIKVIGFGQLSTCLVFGILGLVLGFYSSFTVLNRPSGGPSDLSFIILYFGRILIVVGLTFLFGVIPAVLLLKKKNEGRRLSIVSLSLNAMMFFPLTLYLPISTQLGGMILRFILAIGIIIGCISAIFFLKRPHIKNELAQNPKASIQPIWYVVGYLGFLLIIFFSVYFMEQACRS